MLQPLGREKRHVAADDEAPNVLIGSGIGCLDCAQRGGDSAQWAFAGPAVGNAVNADVFKFVRLADDAHVRCRGGLQRPAQPRNQSLVVELDERFITPKAATCAAGEHKTSNIWVSIHKWKSQIR